jgi:kumamolisin
MIFGTFYLHTDSSHAAGTGLTPIHGSAEPWTATAKLIGHHSSNDQLTVGVLLRTTNSAGQASLLASLANKNSSDYHKWLSTSQFMARFAPSASDVAAVKSFLNQSGLHVLAASSPTLLLATGKTSQIEAAFHTTINDYRLSNGKVSYGNNVDVQVPSNISAAVLGVFGLSNLAAWQSNVATDQTSPETPPPPYGGGPHGSGLTPSQIAGIYDASTAYTKLHDKGQGINLAVFELAGYLASDITHYENHYNLRNVPLINKPVLGGATTDNGASEVELDIELQIAMAPGASDIQVYESPNTELAALSQYLQIADDNTADAISTSWGIPCEYGVNSQVTLAENQIFLQMGAQGQSIFAASGDAGAYGCTRVGIILPPSQSLQVGDPGNQPYITSVGGTSFRQPDKGPNNFDPGTNQHPTYPGTSAEGTWIEACDPSVSCEGSGGGVSRIWAEPDYGYDPSTGQPRPGVFEPAYSETGSYCQQQPDILCREVPDVSLDSDPGTGYSIYCTDPGDSFCAVGEFTKKPGWVRLGGTSCAAPLWAGIAALDDSHHGGRLGLFNYIVYPFDSDAGYASQFHDIVLYTNGYYPAGQYYDMATGIGTPDIYNLVNS